jgi:hypothetical protein
MEPRKQGRPKGAYLPRNRSVCFDEATDDKIRAIAKELNVSESEVVRRCVRKVLPDIPAILRE